MIDDARERRETMTIEMEAERPAVKKPQSSVLRVGFGEGPTSFGPSRPSNMAAL
jgi:hypothetical protein